MSFTILVQSLRLALTASIGLLITSCASNKSADNTGTITKVNPYHLHDINKPVIAADPSYAFNRNALLYGAIGNIERKEREGEYYTVFWSVKDRSQPVTVRLEYRTTFSGFAVKSISQEVTKVKRDNETLLSITGQDFVNQGKITAWRVTLVRGKEVLATYDSYLWN